MDRIITAAAARVNRLYHLQIIITFLAAIESLPISKHIIIITAAQYVALVAIERIVASSAV
jgi:hypothetical protein